VSTRAFVPSELSLSAVQVGQRIELDDEESRYLLKVRRVRPGESLELLDGRGHRWIAALASAGRRAQVEILAIVREPEPPPPMRIVLLGLPDPAATLDALTGASELAATQIVLVRCERSQGHAPSAARIEKVLRAAMRQCGRPSPPELLGGPPGEAWSLADALAHHSELAGVFGDPGPSPADVQAPDSSAAGMRLLVGPEGGLCSGEIEAARRAGFRGVCLGPWILRTPTAVVALLTRLGPRALTEPDGHRPATASAVNPAPHANGEPLRRASGRPDARRGRR
jgi:16S rRNA (uracil1498-N3)-methyltransferase